ncbi:glycoside hydrolase family 113 [Actinomadura sp. 9N215]|uniref:glycoside hydrolase family 113 n=1 Tax=Actinomadura sp. 9N215 TaxID=3375150 RepID=UPI00379BCA6E
MMNSGGSSVRSRGVRAAALLVAVSAVASCSIFGDAGTEGSADRSPAPTAPASTKRQQHGIALPSWSSGDYAGPQAGAYVASIRAAGATWLQLNPTWYQRSPRAGEMHRTEQTASDASLRHIIRLARQAGLRVLLKPHVDLPGDQDRADIRPQDAPRWYAAYTRVIGHYADLARETGVDAFAVGTELAGLSDDRQPWLTIVKTVRAKFRGTLVYAANYDEYEHVAFWDVLDLIGIDAYWPLAGRPTTDVAALRRAWKPILRRVGRFSASRGRPVLFTEAGYVSQRGSTTEPWAWNISEADGAAEQAAAYEALLASCTGQAWWAGVHWWMWDDWPGAAETPRSLSYSPHGKPAERILRRWWRPG